MNSTVSNFSSPAAMLNWVECLVISSMLGLSLLIGIYYGMCRTQNTVKEYMLGGKEMAVFPVTISLVASHTSGVTLLGIPAEIYRYGTQYCATAFSFVLLYYIVTKIYLPVFYNLQLNSLYEYLELRFSHRIRTLASLLFALSLVTFLPVVIYTPALAFNQVTGIPVQTVAPVISLICIFYTSVGGLKAVVWTDTLQSIFTLGSTIFIVILGFIKIGSVSEVLRINREGGRFELFKIMFWTLISMCVVKMVVVCVGMLLYANYHSCDPVATGRVAKVDQILPMFVMEVAGDYPGLTGLFISGVLSAALSTMSAGLNTVAGTIQQDFVQFWLGEKQSQARQSMTIKVIVLLLGLLCASLVFVVERLGALFQMALSLIGIANGALAGLFTLGIFFPRANVKGAMAGAISSLLTMTYIVGGTQYNIYHGRLRYGGKVTSVEGCAGSMIGLNSTMQVETHSGPGTPTMADNDISLTFQISYLYYCLIGTVITLVVGVTVSYFTEPPEPQSLRPELFTPLVQPYLLRSVAGGHEIINVSANDIGDCQL